MDSAGQRLPLEGKLAAQPTDEVASKDWEKAETSIKKQDFHLIRPVCALGTFPSRGRLLDAFSFLAFCFFDSFKKRRKAKPSFFFIGFNGSGVYFPVSFFFMITSEAPMAIRLMLARAAQRPMLLLSPVPGDVV